jgi:hypothetical protein
MTTGLDHGAEWEFQLRKSEATMLTAPGGASLSHLRERRPEIAGVPVPAHPAFGTIRALQLFTFERQKLVRRAGRSPDAHAELEAEDLAYSAHATVRQ